jgi:hypothetical protein
MKKFNTQLEVDNFFEGIMFKFEFISDGMASFKTLNPIDDEGNYIDLMLTFYAEEDVEFFCYVPYEDFSRMQLSEVRIFETWSRKTDQLFFRRFNHHEEN